MFYEKKQIFPEKNVITVTDIGEYSLKDTFECGQCFRYEPVKQDEDYSEYITVVGDKIIRVGQKKRGELIFYDVDEKTFTELVIPYFALDRDLNAIKEEVILHTDSEWLRRAADAGCGIAILRQSPWETLLSFIISQNNNIPRIRKIIKKICSEYGVNISLQNSVKVCPLKSSNGTPCEEMCKNCGVCYTFPTHEEILKNPEGLLKANPGFRYKYMLDAARRVSDGSCSLSDICAAASYEYTKEELKKILGVGDKVAACVALFGFENLEAFPIDVWMKRAIDTYFDGYLDPASLGKYAGVAQQYIFHYIRNLEKEEK